MSRMCDHVCSPPPTLLSVWPYRKLHQEPVLVEAKSAKNIISQFLTQLTKQLCWHYYQLKRNSGKMQLGLFFWVMVSLEGLKWLRQQPKFGNHIWEHMYSHQSSPYYCSYTATSFSRTFRCFLQVRCWNKSRTVFLVKWIWQAPDSCAFSSLFEIFHLAVLFISVICFHSKNLEPSHCAAGHRLRSRSIQYRYWNKHWLFINPVIFIYHAGNHNSELCHKQSCWTSAWVILEKYF